jgi:hypothetical protein
MISIQLLNNLRGMHEYIGGHDVMTNVGGQVLALGPVNVAHC